MNASEHQTERPGEAVQRPVAENEWLELAIHVARFFEYTDAPLGQEARALVARWNAAPRQQ